MNRSQSLFRIALALLFPLAAAAFTAPANARAETRHALVIGNGAYAVSPLRNPPNDARDMAALLGDMGFSVIHKENAGLREMEDAMMKFGRSLKSGGVGVFFYAGHGMQIDGRNYLIPTDARVESESDVKFESLDAGRVLGKMKDAKNRLNIVILDACRDNPFARSFRRAERGLARMDAPRGTLIAYATAPGSVAADGDQGRNGVFTGFLKRHMTVPGLKIEEVLKRVRVDVMKATADRQVPWESSSLTGDFYFASSGYVVTPGGGEDDAPGPVSEPLKPRLGSITVRANVSGAEVFLNGQRLGNAPLKINQVRAGSNRVDVKKDGYETYRTQVDVPPGGAPELTVRLERQNLPEPATPTVSTHQRQAGEVWIEPTTGMEFVWVPGGTFEMGCGSWTEDCDDDEKPVHEVNLDGFWIGRNEVTVANWERFLVATGYSGNGKNVWKCDGMADVQGFSQGKDHPVACISWEEAKNFAEWLSQINPHRFRLPYEAEWEYAARSGGNNEKYSGGEGKAVMVFSPRDPSSTAAAWQKSHENIDHWAWYQNNSGGQTQPVGTKAANGLGIFDMSGNLWEWCQDWYGEYASQRVKNPKEAKGEGAKVIRGGSWNVSAAHCRSTNRSKSSPANRSYVLGFRMVKLP